MKPLFYYFGVARKGKLFSIADIVKISAFGGIDAADDMSGTFWRKELKAEDFFEDYRLERGLLFGTSKGRSVENFLSMGKMLSPNIRKGNLSVFFFDGEKTILFKFNQRMESWKQAKSYIWKTMKLLHIISLKAFKKKTNTIKDDEYSNECNTRRFKSGELSVSICNVEKLYFTIKTDKYSLVKKRLLLMDKRKLLPIRTSIRNK